VSVTYQLKVNLGFSGLQVDLGRGLNVQPSDEALSRVKQRGERD